MRAFWIVLDSAGIGNAPDAEAFGDEGSNTWKTCYDSGKLHIPNMEKLGIYNIDEMNCCVINHIPEQKLSRIMGVSTWKQVR